MMVIVKLSDLVGVIVFAIVVIMDIQFLLCAHQPSLIVLELFVLFVFSLLRRKLSYVGPLT